MITLFEYSEWGSVSNAAALKKLLRDIWSEKRKEIEEELIEGDDGRYQPFLQFDSTQIRANNYIGFIQNEDELIEIYPKVFRHLGSPDKNLMLSHIFFWFSYCRKWRFPFNQANLDDREIDQFPELIIHLIAKQFFEVITSQPLMQYQAVEETLLSPKGTINFSRYISNGLARGNNHLLECDHEPFLFDNKVNRIIKYCVRLLLNQTKFTDNQRLLQEVLFVLDEVDDRPATLATVDSVKLNSFYDDYILIMDMCRSVISQNIYSHSSYDTSHWCMLLPMEYIFEDFVAGFLEAHFSDEWTVEYQKSNAYLVSNPDTFQMQHDIFLTSKSGGRRIIVDTKYKLRIFEKDDRKKGVAQDDLYQVVSYAFRRGCNEVILIYPNTGETHQDKHTFEVVSDFHQKDVIKVTVVDIPFWSMEGFQHLDYKLKSNLKKLLES